MAHERADHINSAPISVSETALQFLLQQETSREPDHVHMHIDRVDAHPVADHVRHLIAQRPDLPVALIARRAGVAPSTLKTILSNACRRPDTARTVNRATAARLLALVSDDLPDRDRGYGGRSTDATAAIRHVQ
ncbi:hypothetical protein, partial [Streptomyces chryseus]